VFGIFASLAEFERELIRERTIAGLMSARARGRNGGRPYKMTVPKLRLAQAAMAKRGTRVGDLCKELGISRETLYRFVSPKGTLRPDATKLLKIKGRKVSSARAVKAYGRRRRPVQPSDKRRKRA
jgi:DNA invertase Pin-like site-specific DNA recombinase